MVCLWRYLENTRNYPGYHLSADAGGCRLLLEKLRSIRGKASIPLDEPDRAVLSVPNNHGGKARWIAGATFCIETSPDYPHSRFAFGEDGGKVVLSCGSLMVGKLLQGVEDMGKGEGDYAIRGDGDCPLWFWWQS